MKKNINPKVMTITKIISAVMAIFALIATGIGVITKSNVALSIALIGSGTASVITILQKTREENLRQDSAEE